MAGPVAEQLGVPLHTHVWDPFSWWAKANRLDGRTTRSVQAKFDRAVSHSKAVATASQAMADAYQERFGAHAIPVIASHASSLAKTPAPELQSDDSLVIGMAGQFYSATEWLSLLEAMRAANWRVAGREVRIVVMGPQTPPQMDESRISFLGWKTQAQAAEILSCCDLLYCPYPFDPGMKEVSQLSFPSKLVLYLAAGRPIVFHGPDYSGPAAYVHRNGCGLVADQLFPTSVYNAIERLVSMPDLYRSCATGAQRAFIQDFTLSSMQRALSEFLDLGAPGDAIRLYSHAASGSTKAQSDRLPDAVRNRSLPVIALKVGRRAKNAGSILKRRAVRAAAALALKFPRGLRE
jgi:glycosyltransferase involved in cell wall biosynthesis